jgi:hypothetical protein
MRTAIVTTIVAASLGLAALLFLRTLTATGAPTAEDRAIALGLLLDTPAPAADVDEGLRVAERLRRRYGIDSGDLHADRVAAALRARDEVLARLEVTPDQLRATAESLGYSLDPARCGSTCGNVARLARLELERRALAAFAAGGPPP